MPLKLCFMKYFERKISQCILPLRIAMLKLKQKLHKEFKKYRNNINVLIRISKGNYYQRFFEEYKQNMLKTWEEIKAIINKRNITKKNINYLNIYRAYFSHVLRAVSARSALFEK